MGFSEDVEQQRSNEMKSLRRWVGWGLTGSFALHALSLSWTMPRLVKPRPTEVVVVPRRQPEVKPIPQVKPQIEPEIKPQIQPEIKPEIQAEIEPAPILRQPIASRILPPGVMPEGEADAERDESPLVGSGLAAGDGGFSEGIGLNRSNSDIRGSGGGERQGVEGGVPGGIIAPPEPIVTAPSPAIVEPVEPPPQSGDPRLAVCRRCPSPEYPRSALQAGAEGRVQMAVDLDSQGRVVGVRLANSSGDAALDRAVLETVRQRWRFENVRGGANNIPVEVYMTVDESELNQRAQDWGDRTAIEIPDAGFATSPVAPTATRTEPVALPEPGTPAVESFPTPVPEPVATPLPEPLPEPVLESIPELLPEPLPEPVLESIPELLPEPVPEPVVEPMPQLSNESIEEPIENLLVEPIEVSEPDFTTAPPAPVDPDPI
jgi:TonB family protein